MPLPSGEQSQPPQPNQERKNNFVERENYNCTTNGCIPGFKKLEQVNQIGLDGKSWVGIEISGNPVSIDYLKFKLYENPNTKTIIVPERSTVPIIVNPGPDHPR